MSNSWAKGLIPALPPDATSPHWVDKTFLPKEEDKLYHNFTHFDILYAINFVYK